MGSLDINKKWKVEDNFLGERDFTIEKQPPQ